MTGRGASIAARGGQRRPARGFTLSELVVGIVVLSLVAAVSATSITAVVRARSASVARAQAFERAQAAVRALSADLWELARDHDLGMCRFVLTSEGQGGAHADELLMYIRSTSPVHGDGDVPEGMDQEAQYRVGSSAGDPIGLAGLSDGAGVLWRRTDAAFDGFDDGGGIALPVAVGVRSLSIEAFDGQRYQQTWESDRDGLPHGVRIEVVAEDDRGVARMTARALVPIDRVPIPWPRPDEEGEEGQEGGS